MHSTKTPRGATSAKRAVAVLTLVLMLALLPQAYAVQKTSSSTADSATSADASTSVLLGVTSLQSSGASASIGSDDQTVAGTASSASATGSSASEGSSGSAAVAKTAATGATTAATTTTGATTDRYTSASKPFFELMAESMPLLLKGLGLTIELAVVSLLLAMVLGMITCLMNISRFKILKWIAQIYINIIRGTPLLVQAFFVYFGVTQALGFKLTAFAAGVISLCLNAGGYLAEIFRGGVQAVDPGQMEAARSLGMSWWQSMRKIILPQAIRICIPSVVNQWIITLKDTSIISVIGLAELTYAGSQIIARTYRSFDVWLMVGILYFVVIYALTKLSKFIERRVTLAKQEG